ncbi:hypothetical protein [[Clostridium] innocuum]|uniref:hypothetical protein n=1 Tax=Clostridium innocuum TaxID=1522 RepID=UPI0002D51B7E|nr:hypothetical protein [[Clostridium] innocuum]MCQ4711260.1 hypothetical protein [[Clostridium] innocuum]
MVYKGEAAGIRVVICEEAIQSKASSIDEDQIPVYGNDVAHTFTGKRIKRGLYRSKNGILMNADINGAGGDKITKFALFLYLFVYHY